MAAKLIQSGITLTRSISGTMTDIRQLGTAYNVDPNIDWQGYYVTADEPNQFKPYVPSAMSWIMSARPEILVQFGAGAAAINYKMNFFADATYSAPGGSFAADEILADGGPADAHCYLHATLTEVGSGNVVAQDDFDEGTFNGVVNPDGTNPDTGLSWLSTAWNQSETFSFTVSGTFDLYADYDTYVAAPVSPEPSWHDYVEDHDPYGPPSRVLKFYYVSHGSLTISWTFGSNSGHKTVTIAADAFPGGLDAFSVQVTALSPNDFTAYTGGMPFSSPQQIASITFNDVPGNKINIAAQSLNANWTVPSASDASAINESGTTSASVNNNTLEVYTTGTGDVGNPPGVIFQPYIGPFVNDHTGSVLNLDDTAVSTEVTDTNDSIDGSSDANGNFNLSHNYNGVYFFAVNSGAVATSPASEDGAGFFYGGTDPIYNTSDNLYGAFSGSGLTPDYNTGGPVIRWVISANLPNLAPDFPFPAIASAYEQYLWYNDSRMESLVSDMQWPAALRISAPTSKTALTFDGSDAANWTATNATVTQSVDGFIEVTASADGASASRDYTSVTPAICLGGARYIQFNCTSDDTSAISVTIGGYTYSVVPGDVIDILSGGGGTDTTQTGYGISQPDPAFGLNNPGHFSISGLHNGKTYTLKNLTLTRKGPMTVRLTDGSFIGAAPGDARVGDISAYGVTWNRKGIITCDGITIAEIADTAHYEDTNSGYWYEIPVCIDGALQSSVPGCAASSDYLMWPVGGMVSHAVDGGTAAWQTGAMEAWFLEAGVYVEQSGAGYVDIPLVVRVDRMMIPVDYQVFTFNYKKLAEGLGWARIVNLDGSAAANAPFTVDTYNLTGGGVIGTDSLTTDQNGECIIPSGPQPQTVGVGFTGLQNNDPTQWLVSVQSGYAGYTVYWKGSDGVPWYGTVSTHTGGVMTVPSCTDAPVNGTTVYILLDYQYEVSYVDGNNATWSGTVRFRNRNWASIVLRGAPILHGLLYDPTTNALNYDATTGALQYI